MKEIAGKMIPETLEELVDPRYTAVINIDLQNDGCSSGGQQDRIGLDISMCRAVLPRVAKLSEGARKAGVLVVHTQNLSLPDHRSDSPAWLRFKMRTYLPEGESDYSPEGTWGADFADEV
ncbi:MAG: cysteine hydrolase family protein, partial [Chloroflexota bacterium]